MLDLAAAGGDPRGVSGSGALAEIRFRAASRGRVEVRLADAIQVRDPDNRPLELKSLEQGVVVVE